MTAPAASRIRDLLGSEAEDLLTYRAKGFPKETLHLPGPGFVDRVMASSDRGPQVLRNMQQILGHGRLAGTGYVSILPVDQGIEHSAGASFAPNPAYFDPGRIVELAIEGGCNAVASTVGVLGACSRKYAHRIPFLVKLNHNELLTYPNRYDQVMFAGVQQAWELGAVAVGATIYFGSEEGARQLQEVSEAFQMAHELGMVTVLWCYLVPGAHPVEMTRYQVANCYMGRAGLINSGGSSGADDFAQAARTAVINKRAGGMGLISGRKAFQRPMAEGVRLLNLIQDVFLDDSIQVA